MVVLLVLVAAGAWLFGLPGALGAYVLGLVAFALLPEKGGACVLPANPRPEAEPKVEGDVLSRKSPPAA